jgi:hypothetical protein
MCDTCVNWAKQVTGEYPHCIWVGNGWCKFFMKITEHDDLCHNYSPIKGRIVTDQENINRIIKDIITLSPEEMKKVVKAVREEFSKFKKLEEVNCCARCGHVENGGDDEYYCTVRGKGPEIEEVKGYNVCDRFKKAQ